MKTLKLYITEALHVNRNTKIQTYNYHPKTKDELKKLIHTLIKDRGINADLNDIDVSEITDMTNMFERSLFNGDISKWDISNVNNMTNMFVFSKFDHDISNWKIREWCNTTTMFTGSRTSEEHKPKSLQRC